MVASRAELMKQIAESSASGGGNHFRDSRGRLALKKFSLESGFKGNRAVADWIVVTSAKVGATYLDGPNAGKPVNAEPYQTGDEVSDVYMLNDPRKDPGFGKVKALLLALFNINDEASVSAQDLVDTLDELDKTNSAKGMLVDYTTRRLVTREKKIEIVVVDYSTVLGKGPDGRQSDEEIQAVRAWMDSLLAAAPAVNPTVPAATA